MVVTADDTIPRKISSHVEEADVCFRGRTGGEGVGDVKETTIGFVGNNLSVRVREGVISLIRNGI